MGKETILKSLDAVFNPKSVALIGASANPLKWGNWIAKRLIQSGFRKKIYFVSNGNNEKIFNKERYKSILDIQADIDLAVIGIPARYVLDSVRECIRKKVRGIIIVTAGFGESGETGKRVENDILKISKMKNVRIVGPNCLGIYNSSNELNTSIFDLSPGELSFLSQSGNFAMDVNHDVKKRKLGYSKWACIGNQIDIRFGEYLDYIKSDSNTKVILFYMEGLFVSSSQDGRDFILKAKQAALQKPLVAIKVGKSAAGARAAASHTGSLSGSEKIFDAAIKQSGIIRVINSSELLDVAEAFTKCPLPKDKKIAILTDGGGHGAMAADAAERYGLEVPVLSDNTQKKLRDILPAQASTKNPIDFAGGAEADLWNFVRCSKVLLQDSELDGLLIVGQFGGYSLDINEEFGQLELKVAKGLGNLIEEFNKPVLMHSIYQPDGPPCLKTLSTLNIPVYPVVEKAIRCMGALHEYRTIRRRIKEENQEKKHPITKNIQNIQNIIDCARKEKRKNLLETEARKILMQYDIPMSAYQLAKNQSQSIEIAKKIGFPIAMKIVSPDILHKSEAKGIILNINNQKETKNAFAELIKRAKHYNKSADIRGVIVTPMEKQGIELIVGMSKDKTFGPTIMFGLGGIFVEALKDVSFRVAPLSKVDALDMIKETKCFSILKGFRGQKGININALTSLLLKISTLAIDIPEIDEIDLNPIFAYEENLSIIDARMTIQNKY